MPQTYLCVHFPVVYIAPNFATLIHTNIHLHFILFPWSFFSKDLHNNGFVQGTSALAKLELHTSGSGVLWFINLQCHLAHSPHIILPVVSQRTAQSFCIKKKKRTNLCLQYFKDLMQSFVLNSKVFIRKSNPVTRSCPDLFPPDNTAQPRSELLTLTPFLKKKKKFNWGPTISLASAASLHSQCQHTPTVQQCFGSNTKS